MSREEMIDAAVRRGFIKFYPTSHRTHMADALHCGAVSPRLQRSILKAWDRLSGCTQPIQHNARDGSSHQNKDIAA